MFLQNAETLIFGDSSMDFILFTLPKHLLSASFFDHFGMLFLEPFLKRLFRDLMPTFGQKVRLWTPPGHQLGPRIDPWGDHFGQNIDF